MLKLFHFFVLVSILLHAFCLFDKFVYLFQIDSLPMFFFFQVVNLFLDFNN
jgi:hypothetical protein